MSNILKQLQDGKKDINRLSKTEQALLDKYPEVYEDIWTVKGGACSWYCGGGPNKVTATSHLKPQGTNTYSATNAHDDSYQTAWVEGVTDYGVGQYLTYTFPATTGRITGISVVNGYVKSESTYKNNSRVKKLRVLYNDNPFAILNLQDKIAVQYFEIPPIGYSNRNIDLSSKPSFTLKFEILEVYEGLKYQDVAITELYFDGIDVHCLAKGTKVLLANQTSANIEELVIGDEIAYLDFETNQIKSAIIEKMEVALHDKVITYHFSSGLEITATHDHPFRALNKGWVTNNPVKSLHYEGFDEIQKVGIGDLFITSKGVDLLISISYQEGIFETYTISKLSEGNNFFANGLIVGVENLKDLSKHISPTK